MVLGKSIYESNNKLVLGSGYRITVAIKKKLVEKGYSHLYIMEKGTEDVIPEDIISDEVKAQAKKKISDKVDQIGDMLKFKEVSSRKIYQMLNEGYLKNINITQEMRKVVEDILDDLTAAGASLMSSMLFKSKNEYQMDHAINTTVLAILIGKKYKFTRAELLDLAVGAFLHDFGKLIIEKMNQSTNAETSEILMKEHPTYGYLLVSNSRNASPIVSQIINQHHENQDGSGYPLGLAGQNLPPLKDVKRASKGTIYRLAEIVSVADTYDRLMSNPKTEEKLSPVDAIKYLVVNSGKVYNKNIINVFTEIIPHYPVGSYVRIKYVIDPGLVGCRGVVAKINKKHLNKPVIILLHDKLSRRIAPKKFDTSKIKNIELELIL